VLDRFRPFLWPALFVTLAAVLFMTKIRTEMVDFGVYRTAAGRALAAEPLYRADDGHYQFKYLPAFALAMAPFAAIDREAAQAIWFALSAGLLTAFVRWSVRGLPERRRSEPVLAGLAVLFMAKFYAHELTLGQTNILLGCLLAAALLAVQIDQPVVAGALIGAAAFVKPYALILLPWLAFTYGLSAALASGVVLVLGLLLPIVRYGWSGNLQLLADWYRTVSASTVPNLTSADNVSLAAMWAKWLGPGGLAAGMTALSSLGALAIVATIWLRRLRVSSPDYLEFALLMILIPLVSPQGWDYVLLLATPAVVLLMDRWQETSIGWRVASGLALAVMSFTFFDLMGRSLYESFMAHAVVSVAAIGLAVAVAQLRWRELA
jgi:glycosyl transferase family 87